MSQPSKESKDKYRNKNREKLRIANLKYYYDHATQVKDNNLRKRYGISLVEYNSMAESQGNVCAICGLPERSTNYKTGKTHPLAVDHNHKTGKVRLLLCYSCNARVGFLENNQDLVVKMQEYIITHNG